MKGLTLLAFLIIGLFVVLLGFSMIGNDPKSGAKDVIVKPLEIKKLEYDYSLQRQENQLDHEKSLSKQRLEYEAYLKKQALSQEENLSKQKLDFESYIQQQKFNQKNTENSQKFQHEATIQQQKLMHDTFSEREKLKNNAMMKKQEYDHEEVTLIKKSEAQQQRLYTWAGFGIIILSLVVAIVFIVFKRYKEAQIKLSLINYEHTSLLEDKRAYHATRMKILDSINNFSAEEQKEIILQLMQQQKYSKKLDFQEKEKVSVIKKEGVTEKIKAKKLE